MKKIIFLLKMPHSTYVGGIATIINSYLSSKSIFEHNNYTISLFDYRNECIDKIKPSKLSNVIYGLAQKRALLKYLSKEKEEVVVHIHTSCRYLFFKDILLARIIKKKLKVSVALSIHVGKMSTVFDNIPKWCKKISFYIMNKYIDKILFLSPKMKEEFVQNGLEMKKAELLYNFHDITFYPKLKKENDVLNIIFVGAINREKGILELLKAMQLLPHLKIHLDICGLLTDKNIEQEFNDLINFLGSKVSLKGYIQADEKNNLYSAADVLVLPSYHEGFPLVILEALATATGIISTEVGTTPEVLTKESVIWIKIADVESIKRAIEILYYDREKLRIMKNVNFIEGKKYSKSNHINNLCKIYDQLRRNENV